MFYIVLFFFFFGGLIAKGTAELERGNLLCVFFWRVSLLFFVRLSG